MFLECSLPLAGGLVAASFQGVGVGVGGVKISHKDPVKAISENLLNLGLFGQM